MVSENDIFHFIEEKFDDFLGKGGLRQVESPGFILVKNEIFDKAQSP